MTNPMFLIEKKIKEAIKNSLSISIKKDEISGDVNESYNIEIPAETSHGDFASNVAMINAKNFRKSPRDIAEIIKKNISSNDEYIKSVEVAGPGFLNFRLHKKWFSETVFNINNSKSQYGHSNIGEGKRVIVEYVSANPTGPMHMGNARGAVLGDTLSTAFEMVGYKVLREFYVNDSGNQVVRLGASLEARYMQLHKGENAFIMPEDAYMGEDIIERVKQFSEIYGNVYINKTSEERTTALINFTLPLNIEKLKTDLEKYRVNYDNWFLESSLHKDNSVNKILEILQKGEYTYEKDGAIWFFSTKFGLDKDDVLVRENGLPTYFLVDIAYHYNKFVIRGYDKGVNIWGADHHGHVERLKNALTTLGIKKDTLDILLMQMVRLVRDGEVVRMSKRTGKAITLNDLIEDVPVSAARFFFNMREPNMAYDFDLDLAVKENRENPVYYVQYAHARIASLVKNLKAEENIDFRQAALEELNLLETENEADIIRQLAIFPNEIIEITKDYDPSKITKYSVDLAAKFHKFYHDSRIKGSEDSLLQARLNLAVAVQIVIKNILDMLKIEAPEIM